jgi:hypothetical protein
VERWASNSWSPGHRWPIGLGRWPRSERHRGLARPRIGLDQIASMPWNGAHQVARRLGLLECPSSARSGSAGAVPPSMRTGRACRISQSSTGRDRRARLSCVGSIGRGRSPGLHVARHAATEATHPSWRWCTEPWTEVRRSGAWLASCEHVRPRCGTTAGATAARRSSSPRAPSPARWTISWQVLGDRSATVFGHSMGGVIATGRGRPRAPEQIRSACWRTSRLSPWRDWWPSPPTSAAPSTPASRPGRSRGGGLHAPCDRRPVSGSGCRPAPAEDRRLRRGRRSRRTWRRSAARPPSGPLRWPVPVLVACGADTTVVASARRPGAGCRPGSGRAGGRGRGRPRRPPHAPDRHRRPGPTVGRGRRPPVGPVTSREPCPGSETSSGANRSAPPSC